METNQTTKNSTERVRRYRARQKALQLVAEARNPSTKRPPPITPAERTRRWREKKRLKLLEEMESDLHEGVTDLTAAGIEDSSNGAPNTCHQQAEESFHYATTPPIERLIVRDERFAAYWRCASDYFEENFRSNSFGHACNVCDRLWFKNDLRPCKESFLNILEPIFGPGCESYYLCQSCHDTLKKDRIPVWSTSNGLKYPDKPHGLPPLDPISTRLISPRIPFMSLRRLRYDGSLGIIGQVINVPVDVNSMVTQLPRQLDEDYAINVSIKRKLIHKSSYLKGFVKKRDLRAWLQFLVQQPLYKHYNIQIDWSALNGFHDDSEEAETHDNSDIIEDLDHSTHEQAALISRQQTLLWHEDSCLDIAPGQNSKPINLIFDPHAEELSFPSIYYGVARNLSTAHRITNYTIANSETRRRDRRGATPEHILFMAMKILRMRVVDGIQQTFKRVSDTDSITRRMIEDPEFVEKCVEKDLAFLKSIPNSCKYWVTRKLDLFAMIRQLGKPTAFLTLSANEVNWPDLLSTLNNLSDHFKHLNVNNPLVDLTRSMRAHLVNEDPVVCCAYFYKLVEVIMQMLGSISNHNPFGKYRVLDYFMRFEFQHRGSPHAHILLWLNHDPKENVSENMPKTIQLITDLLSASRDDVSDDIYNNQVHRHTFTCNKRGESSCRFNIPYWPIDKTRVLLPLSNDDSRTKYYKSTAKRAKKVLEEKRFDTMSEYLNDLCLDYESYLNVIRSTLTRPTVLFKRKWDERMTNTFNPWIATVLNSNMDIQFILDEYSCANYVVDYVNKSNRGLSNLHRELIKLTDEHPHLSQNNLLRKLGARVLNSVEMSAQEAAWYLLRQDMSRASRHVMFIPTCWPAERYRSHKNKAELTKLDPDSTDIWTKNLIQKYEERPSELESYCLADFVAEHKLGRTSSNLDADDLVAYNQRRCRRVIRYCNYASTDLDNFKREMVLLFVPFRNEHSDIIDRGRYLTIYSENIHLIGTKRCEYEIVTNMEQLVEELRQAEKELDTSVIRESSAKYRDRFVKKVLLEGEEENFQDFDTGESGNRVVSTVRKRNNVISKEDYCKLMRTTNKRQRELILEFIHRLTSPPEQSQPMQLFFTGPAGCGKTYVLKLIMETVNRFSTETNDLDNSYLACASTGKAAVTLGGTTVHSAFHLTQSRRVGPIAREALHKYRTLFRGVKCVIIDEVSMIGNSILHQLNQRLQQITGDLEAPFGGMSMIFCGDFRQLPPVRSAPVYKATRDHIRGNTLWQMLDYFNLDQVMRQTNVVFSEILTKIGDGRPLTSSESELIESRFRTEEWCDKNLTDTVRLYHQNHLVDSYNHKVLQDGQAHISKDLYSGYKTNAELVVAKTKLHKFSTVEASGLAYCVQLKLDRPYMITTNIDLEDGLVNGAIGTLKHYQRLPPPPVIEGDSDDCIRLITWISFDNEHIGANARLKFRSSQNNNHAWILENNWTPIYERSANIDLGGAIRCRRTQLPIASACAITIHKSQGGTFKEAVISYDKSLTSALVYVALSRVECIEGLYLVNSKDDFVFHHKRGNFAPHIKEVCDEYQRLSSHPLATLTGSLNNFMSSTSSDGSRFIIVSTINAQSLVAHYKDIQSDTVLNRSDILCITETWMADAQPVEIDGFELIVCKNNSLSTGSARTQLRRLAGGVAIYRNIALDRYKPVVNSKSAQSMPMVGDAAFVELEISHDFKLSICSVYLHPGCSNAQTLDFMGQILEPYYCHVHLCDSKVLVTGDFNRNVTEDDWIARTMQQNLMLSYVPTQGPTTLGCTTIDLTFERNLRVACKPYVAYFSYHRPLINKIEI